MKSRGKGIALSYVNTGLTMVCGLFLSAFLLRKLGATDYGVYQTIASFANCLVLLEFGVGTVMARNISMCQGRGASQEELHQNISTLWVITNVLVLVLVGASLIFNALIEIAFAGTLTNAQINDAHRLMLFISLHLIFSFYIQTVDGIILAYENYSYGSIQKIIKTILRTALMIVLVQVFHTSLVVAVVDAGVSLLLLGFALWYCRRKLAVKLTVRKFSYTVFRNSAPLCLALFMQTVVNQVNSNADKFIIGIMMGPEEVALYSVGMYVYSIFSSLTTIPISFYAPRIAQQMSRGKVMADIHGELVGAGRLIATVGGLALFGFVAVGKQFISLVYGEEYLFAWVIAVILMVPMYLNMCTGVLVNVLDVLNKRIVRSCVLIITTMCNIVLTVFWIQSHGMLGAALATAVCVLVGQTIVMFTYYSKVLGVKMRRLLKDILRGNLIALLLATVVSYLIGQWIKGVLLSFLVGGIVFVAVFGAVFILWGQSKTNGK